MNTLNTESIDAALESVKTTYAQLIKDGIDPASIVIAMSEIIAYCLAHKAVTGGGDEETLRNWRRPFEKTYHEQLREIRSRR